MRILFVFILLCVCIKVEAYPNFIGYGYNACITCHYNGQGGGALTDYGRSLFATEITARDIYPDETDEEKIAADAGFLPQRPLPWWVRPGIKYRGLWLQNNPGSAAKSEKFYNMQSDVNLNFFFDQNQNYTLVTTASYTTYPRSFATSREDKTPYWFAKEYYLRWQSSIKNLWVYIGQMDKVFGLRLADHTAVNRGPIGFGQFDQSQGVVVEYAPAQWSIAGNIFLGNASETAEVRQNGGSLSGEYEIYEKYRIGASALSSRSESVEWKRLAGFMRMGLSKGSSLMGEVGLMQNRTLSSSTNAVTGVYGLVESWILFRRGYNLLSTLEYAKTDLQTVSAEKMRWGLGGILFPLPRTEVRPMLINYKNASANGGVPDSWQLQLQVHISL